jgi:hypothetical protein
MLTADLKIFPSFFALLIVTPIVQSCLFTDYAQLYPVLIMSLPVIDTDRVGRDNSADGLLFSFSKRSVF